MSIRATFCWTSWLWLLIVGGGVTALTRWAATPAIDVAAVSGGDSPLSFESLSGTVREIDQHLAATWAAQGLTPAEPAEELSVLRRLSLALHGTIPSLEEIRRFEADQAPNRLDRWTLAMLEDNRFHDYFAQRLARVFVGAEEGQFLVFRRDRLHAWLSERLAENVPYDQLVRELITATGVWTGEPAANFITAAFANDAFDQNKLATRTVRAFLGQSMDCAQCHDHPFSHWKQSQFEGIAACFGQVRLSLAGIGDDHNSQYHVEDQRTLEKRVVPPDVPFGMEWWPDSGTPRERLAIWITHPDNLRFHRAIANRMWGLLFGKPYYAGSAVDDLPDPDDPDEADTTRVLDLLAADFQAHGCDLRRLIRVIAATRAFRIESAHPDFDLDELAVRRHQQAWALFPLIRLRPEQIIGSMLQAGSVQTIDQNSHLLIRTVRFFRERDFVNAFGDPGDAELEERAGTIPQALLRMNGQLARELTEQNPFTAVGRIASLSSSPERIVENCYLSCLTRRPTPEEQAHFVSQLIAESRGQTDGVMQDLYWSLFNSAEFSWNH